MTAILDRASLVFCFIMARLILPAFDCLVSARKVKVGMYLTGVDQSSPGETKSYGGDNEI